MKPLTLAVLLIFSAAIANAEKRLALVIGNSDYKFAPRLENPINDARAMSAKLSELGFEVIAHENLGYKEMGRAIAAFNEAALGADLVLAYYAGHGIELSGRNYLIPVDAEMEREAFAQFESIALDPVIGAVKGANSLGLVLLDACRDNPFAPRITRTNGTRSVSRGLAPINIEGETGLIVSFAAQEGRTADDGTGDHSPYTAALLEVMDEPGLEVGQMFRKVNSRVRKATGDRQRPVTHSQLTENWIYFVPGGATPAALTKQHTTKPDTAPVARDATAIYLDAVTSGKLEALVEFTSRYPSHPKAEDARKLVTLMQDDTMWQKVSKDDSTLAYRRYMIAFPEGQHVGRAKDRIAALNLTERSAGQDKTIPQRTQPVTPTETSRIQTPPETGTGPGSDCSYASSYVENAICGYAELSKQDRDMAAAFNVALANGWVDTSHQRDWLGQRDAACNITGWDLEEIGECVSIVTTDRIAALHAGRPWGNVWPAFNCAKASTPVEQAICHSDILARQDQYLMQAYQDARNRNVAAAGNQGSWIREREARCSNHNNVANCVAGFTAQRFDALVR